jgi:hypothetical protein
MKLHIDWALSEDGIQKLEGTSDGIVIEGDRDSLESFIKAIQTAPDNLDHLRVPSQDVPVHIGKPQS